jgi:lipopolysaccharide export system permease protein
MMKLLDRQLLYSYIKAYAICLVSLLSLYVVVDLFTNIDDFTQHKSLLAVLEHIGTYYGYKSSQIFDRLSEAIALLAAMFTVAWMQRNNELVPLLSAGLSTQRVVRPVLFSACLMLGLSVANQELVIPRIAPFLTTDRDDAGHDKEIAGPWGYEPNGIHLEGHSALRKEQVVRILHCTIPENIANGLLPIDAKQAKYIPPGNGRYSQGWLLTETKPAELENWTRTDILEMIEPGTFFLHVKELDFKTMTRNKNWFILASTMNIYREMCRPDSMRLPAMAVLFHRRLTRPIMGMLLIFLGLSMILRDQNRNVFISAGMCLLMCAVFFAADFLCKHLGDHEVLPPALTAWLPVLFFGPLAFVLFDAVHT